jgi:ribose transport system ATP-binding protein
LPQSLQPAPLLAASGLCKYFGGAAALDCVDLEVNAGEVHALLGENGAGKSTLIKILAGVYVRDAGDIRMEGRLVEPATERLPVSFIHQDLGLVDTMSVAENIAIVAGYPRRRGLIAWKRAKAAALSALDRMGGGVNPDANVGGLTAAEKSIVAIARALAVNCKILVLDEPTAALPEADVAGLLAILQRLKEGGLGILYVTHRLDEVFRIADRVTVLRDGRKVTMETVANTKPADLVHAIVGRPLSNFFISREFGRKEIVLAAERLVSGDVGPISFVVAKGEIVALVGLRGAGHDVVGRAIFGDARIASGSLRLNGSIWNVTSSLDAIRRGVGFVSSKRGEESLAPNLTILENLYINPTIREANPLRPMRPTAERRDCLSALRRFSVRPPTPERPVATLSGGNQQKVVLARWFEAGSRLLVLEEPTFGVDVGSKAEIYGLLQDGLADGLAVLLVSSDFEEVAGISNRALVFNRGQVCAELRGSGLSIAGLTSAASGGEASAREPEIP